MGNFRATQLVPYRLSPLRNHWVDGLCWFPGSNPRYGTQAAIEHGSRRDICHHDCLWLELFLAVVHMHTFRLGLLLDERLVSTPC